MILPDISTFVIIIVNVTWIVLIAWRAHSTKKIVEELERSISPHSFVLARSIGNMYSSALMPLIVLLPYLGLYVLGGSPSWDIDNGITIDPSMLALALITSWIFLLTFWLAFIESSEFFVVSDTSVERHLGSKARTVILWDEVTHIRTNTDFPPETDRFLSILVFSGKRRLSIDKSLSNMNKFYVLATERLPLPVRVSGTYTWMQSKSKEKAA